MKLISGGILLARNSKGAWMDITPQAHMNLYKDVTLENVTIKDIYTLIGNNSCLQQVLHYNCVVDFISYLKQEKFTTKIDNNNEQKIEFVELFRSASYDSELNTLEFDEQPCVQGLSYPLTKNYQSYKAGQRVCTGLDRISIVQLLNIPIILNSKVFCATSNYLSHYDFSNQKTFERARYSLLDILNAITLELSFHEEPFGQAEQKSLFNEDDIQSKYITEENDELDESIEETFTSNKYKEKTLLKGFSSIHSSINKNDLNNILNYLPNKIDITLFFNHILPSKIFLKEEFIGLTAYEYRHKVYEENSDLLPSISIQKTITENKSLLNIHHNHVELELFYLIKAIGGRTITAEELFALNTY